MGERPPTPEERARARRLALIRAAVQRHTGGERPATGAMVCPACEDGEAGFVVTRAGQIYASCTTPGCCEEWLEGADL